MSVDDADVDAVVQLVKARDYVSFTEIERLLAQRGVSTQGDVTLTLPDRPSIVLWAGMSDAFFEIMAAVLRGRRIHLIPASQLVYLVDGGMLRLPLAKRVIQYKKPHWLPVTFRYGPPAESP
jgi:hypothetical protein